MSTGEDATRRDDEQGTAELETLPSSIKRIYNRTSSAEHWDDSKSRASPVIDPALEHLEAPLSERSDSDKTLVLDPALSQESPPTKVESLRELLDSEDPPVSPSYLPPPPPSPYPPIPPFPGPHVPQEHGYDQRYAHQHNPHSHYGHRMEPYPLHYSYASHNHRRHHYDYPERPALAPIATHSPSPSSTPPVHHLPSPPLSAPLYYHSPGPAAHLMIPPPPPQHHPHSATGVSYTDDAGTKLTDRVRRRCFNCCTTETTTWRRSNLNPGKVLCNKCGLFERTHSRPRPQGGWSRKSPQQQVLLSPTTATTTHAKLVGAGMKTRDEPLTPISAKDSDGGPVSLPSVSSWDSSWQREQDGPMSASSENQMQLPPLSTVAAAVGVRDA